MENIGGIAVVLGLGPKLKSVGVVHRVLTDVKVILFRQRHYLPTHINALTLYILSLCR